jgi:hypothetical protein
VFPSATISLGQLPKQIPVRNYRPKLPEKSLVSSVTLPRGIRHSGEIEARLEYSDFAHKKKFTAVLPTPFFFIEINIRGGKRSKKNFLLGYQTIKQNPYEPNYNSVYSNHEQFRRTSLHKSSSKNTRRDI